MPGMGTSDVPFGLSGGRQHQSRHRPARLLRGLFDEHPEIRGHQFVAAAPRVQLEAERAELSTSADLHKVVHVLGRRIVQPGWIVDRARARSHRAPRAICSHFLGA